MFTNLFQFHFYFDPFTVFTSFFSALEEIMHSLSRDIKLYCIGSLATSGLSPIYIDPILEKSPDFPPRKVKIKFTGMKVLP